MAYIKKTVRAGRTIEVIKYHDRAHGRKGGKREKRKGPTSPRQALSNAQRREQRLRWLLNENFEDGDLFLTIVYIRRMGEEPISPEKMKENFNRFIRKLRAEYRKRGKELKWVHSMEIGSRGARHHHIVLNYMDVRLIMQVWYEAVPDPEEGKGSAFHPNPLNTDGQYGKVAAYMMKQTAQKLDDEDRLQGKAYSCSRNLRKPKVEKEVVGASTFRKEPKPLKGYYIEKGSIIRSQDGDGYDYLAYRMIQIGQKGGPNFESVDFSAACRDRCGPADVGDRGGPKNRSRAKR